MRSFLYIFLGGGAGSVARYLLSAFIPKFWKIGAFPTGTFLVNIFGCLMIGIFSALLLKNESPLKFLLITGFCGGFTTFSTFSAENFALWQQGNYFTLAMYILLSVVFGLAAVMLGFGIIKS